MEKKFVLENVKEAIRKGSKINLIKHNNGDLDIWVNSADKNAIESGGVDVIVRVDGDIKIKEYLDPRDSYSPREINNIKINHVYNEFVKKMKRIGIAIEE